MRLRIATWNINSIRPRIDLIGRFVEEAAPDVLCFQEIKCQNAEFPKDALAALGFTHYRISGQKGWHGVAIASRYPIEDAPDLSLCREGHARQVGAMIEGVEIQNVYVPAGGDVPDPAENPKFDHKLDFLGRMARAFADRAPQDRLLLVGDLNVAPGVHDVWSHKQLLTVVSHTPVEIAAMGRLQASLDFVDLLRLATPEPQKLYSWWSYRSVDFRASDRGRRLDHMWISPGLRPAVEALGAVQARIHDIVREWPKTSDHAPVSADFRI